MGEQRVRPAPVVVTMPAEIDLTNADPVSGDLIAAFKPGVSLVIADMTATVFCDTAGLRALLRAHETAAGRGISLHVVVPPDGLVRRALELTGIIQVLPVYGSREEAVRGR